MEYTGGRDQKQQINIKNEQELPSSKDEDEPNNVTCEEQAA